MQPQILKLPDAGEPILTVRAIIELYLRHSVVEGTHCPEALAERQRTLGLFAEQYGDLLVANCKAFHLTDWIESHPRWRSLSTRRSKANQVSACFQWAANGERIDRNPFAHVKYGEAERRPELPDERFHEIVELGSAPFATAVRFLRYTGCRLGELCEASWSDVDLERGVWTIGRHKSRRYTRKAKIVALVPEAVDLLTTLRAVAIAEAEGPDAFRMQVADTSDTRGDVARLPVGTIFANSRGTPWNRRTLGQTLRRMKARGLIDTPASLHGIRHRALSAAINAGAPIKMVAEQAGHSSVAVTEKYYHHFHDSQLGLMRAAMQLGLPVQPLPTPPPPPPSPPNPPQPDQ